MINFIAWIVLGAIAGWLASVVMHSRMGLVADIIVGIIGAFIGGFVLSLLGLAPGSGLNLGGIVTAFIGAVILLAILRAIPAGRAV